MTTMILLALLGAAIAAIVGTIWYSMATPMGKWHMQYLGFDKLTPQEQHQKMQEAKPKMPLMYGAQLLLSFMTSLFIVFVASQVGGMVYGYIAMIWAAFVIPLIGSSLLWSNCDRALVWKKFASDALNNLVTYYLIAFVILRII